MTNLISVAETNETKAKYTFTNSNNEEVTYQLATYPNPIKKMTAIANGINSVFEDGKMTDDERYQFTKDVYKSLVSLSRENTRLIQNFDNFMKIAQDKGSENGEEITQGEMMEMFEFFCESYGTKQEVEEASNEGFFAKIKNFFTGK